MQTEIKSKSFLQYLFSAMCGARLFGKFQGVPCAAGGGN
jgi:hypothetical protein